MAADDLQAVANAVVQLAKRQSYVTARDVRSELRIAGLREDRWKDVIVLARPALGLRQSRYYHKEALSPRLQKELAQQVAIGKAIRRLIRHHRSRDKKNDRRGEARIDFIQPVKVVAEYGRQWTLLSRDLSTTGIRLVGTRRLGGQKVHVFIPCAGRAPLDFLVRILWTCPIGDDLVENGGTFLSVGAG